MDGPKAPAVPQERSARRGGVVSELPFRHLVFGENRRQKPRVIDCPGGRVTLRREAYGAVRVEFPSGARPELRRGVLSVVVPYELKSGEVEPERGEIA
jgi:hypothetical protein